MFILYTEMLMIQLQYSGQGSQIKIEMVASLLGRESCDTE